MVSLWQEKMCPKRGRTSDARTRDNGENHRVKNQGTIQNRMSFGNLQIVLIIRWAPTVSRSTNEDVGRYNPGFVRDLCAR